MFSYKLIIRFNKFTLFTITTLIRRFRIQFRLFYTIVEFNYSSI